MRSLIQVERRPGREAEFRARERRTLERLCSLTVEVLGCSRSFTLLDADDVGKLDLRVGLVSHGGVADMCLLGEPTEGKVVLGHFGALWLRIRAHGNFIHTAFSEGKRDQNSILRMHTLMDAVQEWIPRWEGDPANSYLWRKITPGQPIVGNRMPQTGSITDAQHQLIADWIARGAPRD